MHYRIKIEERNNGEKLYIPQICKLQISEGWIQRQYLVWYNILGHSKTEFHLSQTSTAKYASEESAMKIIEDYKNKDVIEEGNKVKSTTFKMIEL